MRFVRVPPYESGVKLTNFYFSWENGAILLSGKCCPLFHTQNEELSKKNWRMYMYVQSRIRKYVTGGQIRPSHPGFYGKVPNNILPNRQSGPQEQRDNIGLSPGSLLAPTPLKRHPRPTP